MKGQESAKRAVTVAVRVLVAVGALARQPAEVVVTAVTIGVLAAAGITPQQVWDSFFLQVPAASEDFMAERAGQEQADREAL